MLSKGSTGQLKVGRQQLGKDLVAGAFFGMMALASPLGAQPVGAPSGGREHQGPGAGFLPVVNHPVGPMQPSPRIDDERQRRTRPVTGDRRLSPEEKWQLRQLLKVAQ